MDQPVYLNMNTFRLMPQNPEEQQQQQQQFQSQGIIMTGNEQTQEVLLQEDQSHIVYSPLKQNEQQFVTQDESMQNSYLIQSSQQQPQQVFYTNISPQNQNRIQQQQTIALNHNLLAQQNQGQKVSSLPRTSRKISLNLIFFLAGSSAKGCCPTESRYPAEQRQHAIS